MFRVICFSYGVALCSHKGCFVRDYRYVSNSRFSNVFYVIVGVLIYGRATLMACRSMNLRLYQVRLCLWLCIFNGDIWDYSRFIRRCPINFLWIVSMNVISITFFNRDLRLTIFMITRSMSRCNRRCATFALLFGRLFGFLIQ